MSQYDNFINWVLIAVTAIAIAGYLSVLPGCAGVGKNLKTAQGHIQDTIDATQIFCQRARDELDKQYENLIPLDTYCSIAASADPTLCGYIKTTKERAEVYRDKLSEYCEAVWAGYKVYKRITDQIYGGE